MKKIDKYQQRIHDAFPELSIEQISLNEEGLNNDIIVINEELIFRFSKNEYGIRILSNEVKIIELIKKYITITIPNIFYKSFDCIGYFMICGVALRKDILCEINKERVELVAEQLATFIKELHSVPIDKVVDFAIPSEPNNYEYWLNLYQRLHNELFPYLRIHTREWAVNHFEAFLDNKSNFEYEPKLIHGDLGCYHILFDRQKNYINGIIDFGTCGLGDPAMDIAVIIHTYGETFLNKFYKVYPEISSYLKRARFYAETIELQWALSGIKSKDFTWLLCHLGSAKDINYQEKESEISDITVRGIVDEDTDSECWIE